MQWAMLEVALSEEDNNSIIFKVFSYWNTAHVF